MSDMANKSWLENLKMHDTVIITGLGIGGHASKISKVVRTTKTLIVCEGFNNFEMKFDKRGYQKGLDVWRPVWLEEPTEEKILEIRKVNLISRIKSLADSMIVSNKGIDNMEYKDLRTIHNLLKKYVEEK